MPSKNKTYYVPDHLQLWKDALTIGGVKVTPATESIGFLEVFDSKEQLQKVYPNAEVILTIQKKKEE